MNILYLTKAFPIREYKISEALLENRNFNIYAVTFSRRFSLKLNRLNTDEKIFSNVFDYTNWFQNNSINNKEIDFYNKELAKLEKKYNIPTFNLIVTADRYLKNKDEKFIRIHLYNSFQFLYKLISENEIDIIIGEISSATDYIAYYIAKEYDIKYISPWHARQKNKIAFTDNNDNWFKLKEKYFNLKKRDLTKNEKNKINKFIEDYISSKKIPDYMKYNDETKKKKIKPQKDDSFIEIVKDILCSVKIDTKYAIDYNHSIKNKIIKRINGKLFGLTKNKNIFDEFNKNEKYVLVPLHYQPEASTMTLAPFYLEQLTFIKNLSKAIPIDYYLYVKEHPAMLTNRNKDFYKKLKKIHNVKLIDPSLNIHNILPEADAICTITNTTGYEAIIYDKPLFVFGNVFYDIYDYSFKINSYYELVDQFSSVIKNWEKNKEERREIRYKFIEAVNKSIYDGNFNSHLKDPSVLSKSNLSIIANSIIKVIDSLKS